MESVGVYEYNSKDLIGHGAFAVVYRGRLKMVSETVIKNRGRIKALCLRQIYDWCGDLLRRGAAAALCTLRPPQCTCRNVHCGRRNFLTAHGQNHSSLARAK